MTRSPRTVRLGRMVPSELDASLAASNWFTIEGEWSEDARTHGIAVDLSRVKWVDLGAAVQLSLTLVQAQRVGVSVEITLPCLHELDGDPMAQAPVGGGGAEPSDACHQRRSAAEFLRKICFYESLTPPGGEEARLAFRTSLPDGSSGGPADAEEFRSDPFDPPERILQLRWIRAEQGLEEAVGKFFERVLGLPEYAERSDVVHLKDVVLFDLLQNAVRGLVSDHALLAMFMRTPVTVQGELPHHSRYRDLLSDAHESEQAWLAWISQFEDATLDLLVGQLKPAVSLPAMPVATFEENETFAALWRWSTDGLEAHDVDSRRLVPAIRGTLRRHHGSLVLRQASRLVGRDHGGVDHTGAGYEGPLWQESLAHVPGTMLRLRLHMGKRVDIARPQPPPAAANVRLEVVPLGDFVTSDPSRSGTGTLTRALSEVLPEEPTCVLGVFSDSSTAASSEAVTAMLRSLVAQEGFGALVLSALPAQFATIERAAHQLDTLGRPVLILGTQVLARDGTRPPQTVWVGVAPGVRKVLDTLLHEGQPLDSTALEALLDDATLPTTELTVSQIMALADSNPHLLEVDAGWVRLRYNLPGLADLVGQKLAVCLMQDVPNDGVYRGKSVLTPSLESSRVWIHDADSFLRTHLGNQRLAAFALAVRIREHAVARELLGGRRRVRVLAAATASSRSLSALADALGTRPIELPGELGMPLGPLATVVQSAGAVILYTDLLLSDDAVARCVEDILRSDGTVAGVAVLFDGRPAPQTDLHVAGQSIPVVALASLQEPANLDVPTAVTERCIDPLTLRLEATQPTKSRHLVSRTLLEEVVGRSGAVFLGHVPRPASRHFTLYLDPKHIVEDDALQRVLKRRVEAWRNGQSFSVWFPETGDEEPRSRRLAQVITSLFDGLATLHPVERMAVEPRWHFDHESAANMPENPLENVVVVDWGSVSGDTVLNLARLATAQGARRVLALVLLGQFSTSRLEMLDAISGFRVPSSHSNDVLCVSEFEFTPVLRTPFQTFGIAECPLCRQIATLQGHEPVTPLLDDHRRRLRVALSLRDRRESLAAAGSSELFASPVDGHRAVNLIQVYQQLVDAERSTRARGELVLHLYRLQNLAYHNESVREEARLLLQLLAFENQWMSRFPLVLERVREVLASIATTIACRPSETAMARLHAIVVLRAASGVEFARQFVSVVEVGHNNPSVLLQALHEAATLIQGPLDPHDEATEPLVKGLGHLVEREDRPEAHSFNRETHQLIRVLHRRGLDKLLRSESRRRYSPKEAWNRLRGLCRVKLYRHGPVRPAMERLWEPLGVAASYLDRLARAARPLADEPPARLRAIQGRIADDWELVRLFLDEHLLPMLSCTLSQLGSQPLRERYGDQNIDRLLGLALARPSATESTLGQLIGRLREDPYLLLDELFMEQYHRELGWWNRVVVPTTNRAGGEEPDSTLLRLVRSMPASLRETLARVQVWAEGAYPRWTLDVDGLEDTDLFVFCPDWLAEQAFRDLLDNVHKHGVEGSWPHVLVQVVQPTVDWDDYVRVDVLNTATRPMGTPGQGNGVLRRLLSPFGAVLQAKRAEPPWTYLATLRFLRTEDPNG